MPRFEMPHFQMRVFEMGVTVVSGLCNGTRNRPFRHESARIYFSMTLIDMLLRYIDIESDHLLVNITFSTTLHCKECHCSTQ